jgi:hypothetical protein
MPAMLVGWFRTHLQDFLILLGNPHFGWLGKSVTAWLFPDTEGESMKRVTRNIDPGLARDLLERVPRACICFADDRGPQAQPVVLVWHDRRYSFGIAENVDAKPSSGQEVVLLVDEGVDFFDLRALYVRGRVQPAEPPRDAPAGHEWFEVTPLKTVAWDYGALREVSDENG